MNVELVKFKNKTGLYLDGIYYNNSKSTAVIIHIHGSFGNFYSNSFINTMGKKYTDHNINFLSINLTQHDGLAEGIRSINNQNYWEYIGYSISDYNECVNDIYGAIQFAKSRGNQRIILQGHSLGCNRILLFLSKAIESYDIILLSPTNSKDLQQKWIAPESLDHQIERLINASDQNFINYKEHGVNTTSGYIDNSKDDAPYIPICNKALLSLITNDSLDIIQFVTQTMFSKSNIFFYFGGDDEYQTDPLSEYVSAFEASFANTEYLFIKGGTHNFSGYEDDVIDAIISWISKER